MSKKELLERISRTPADGRAKRSDTGATPTGGPATNGGEAVTTRVSGRVVRRRARDAGPEEPAPPPTVVRRRPALEADRREQPSHDEERHAVVDRDVEAAPEAPPPRQVEVEPRAAEPEREVVRAEAERPAEPAPAPERVEARPAEPERVEARPPQPEPAVEPEPVAPREEAARPVAREEAPRPVAREERPREDRPRQERPREERPREERPREERPREPERARRPEPDRAVRPERAEQPRAAGEPSAEGEAEGVPERPRFPGLGKGVVMPPPGYDPTNPQAFRRRVEAQTAPSPRQAPAAAPGGDENVGRRRRVETQPGPTREEDRGGANRRGRRSTRPTPNMGEGMGMRRRPRRKAVGGAASRPSPAPKASKRKIRIDNVISVGQLAHELGVKAPVVIKQLIGMGRMATVNDMLDLDTAALIASEFEYEVINAGFQEDNFLQHIADEAEEENAEARPPVVTIMGHVDHGKTTLLDAIRAAKVASGEAGGITQHIGAYQVEKDGNRVTFIDTPGHAAFTAMRARGASITDIVVLVVAADDGVQAQTEEAIAHARAADVPIVVAINKMDKPGVNPDNIKNKLAELGLQPEDWGGDTIFVPVSALKKTGIDDLIEAILLQSEVLELTANADRHGEGVVIEARVERGRGAVATLLVQKGTIKRGDNVVLGSTYGRIRAMMDHTGKQLKEAGPSMPIEIFGLSDVPETGDTFVVVKNEKDARTLAEHRGQEKRQASLGQTGRRTAADIFAQAEAADKEVLPLILKADVQGSLEALRSALQAITVKGTELRFLHAGVGEITESDVNLAAANGSLLIGFNTRLDSMARQAADSQNVTPEIYDVIYSIIDRVTARMKGLLGPTYKEVRQGEAEVRAVFNISKIGRIAGCYIRDGKIGRNYGARVFRDGKQIWEGKINTLKRFKEDVREVQTGYECGIGLEGFDLIEVGDTIQTFSQEQVEA